MLEEAAPYTYVYGGDPPFGFGIYISQEECFKDQVRKRTWYTNSFTKTGSGQTWGKQDSKKDIRSLAG